MTTFHTLLELKLSEATHGSITLAGHVAAKRGDGWTWQQIADNLHDITGLDVSRETLRQWFPEQQ